MILHGPALTGSAHQGQRHGYVEYSKWNASDALPRMSSTWDPTGNCMLVMHMQQSQGQEQDRGPGFSIRPWVLVLRRVGERATGSASQSKSMASYSHVV